MKKIVSKLLVLTCLVFALSGCDKRQKISNFNFRTDAWCLRGLLDSWNKQGRPTGFEPSSIVGASNQYFVFTNIITASNTVFHCRFGTSDLTYPAGVLAIADEGVVLWIPKNGGDITISPEVNGIYGVSQLIESAEGVTNKGGAH